MRKNEQGNIDIRQGLEAGLTHVVGQRLGPLCRRLKIDFAPAVIGYRKWYLPIIHGVVVADADAPALLAAISERIARTSAPKKAVKVE
jgi:hypothetical protein